MIQEIHRTMKKSKFLYLQAVEIFQQFNHFRRKIEFVIKFKREFFYIQKNNFPSLVIAKY